MAKNITFEEWENRQLQDPEFCEAAARLEPGHQVARLRIRQGLTQAQLAERSGTTQSAIARLESGRRDPSLTYLRRVLAALGYGFELSPRPLEECGA
jgi:transcriptional regulator with XRE-family HTH domain